MKKNNCFERRKLESIDYSEYCCTQLLLPNEHPKSPICYCRQRFHLPRFSSHWIASSSAE